MIRSLSSKNCSCLKSTSRTYDKKYYLQNSFTFKELFDNKSISTNRAEYRLFSKQPVSTNA
jgi:hypothetical protein